jgi:cell division protein FtsI/penicillin-binding protein 2
VALTQRRIGLLFAVFLALLAAAALRTLYLGTVRGEALASAALTQQAATVEVPARRGTIVDRRGVELAVSEPASDVSATPYLVKDAARVARRLAPILEREETELLRALTREDTGFVYLARAMPAARAERVEEFRVPGLTVTPANRRVYPRGWLASPVLGTVGTDGQGLSGLEHAHEAKLRGRAGERRVVRDALGDPISVRERKAARPGARLSLTVDAAIQDEVESAMATLGATFSPEGATAVVMDPRDGDLLALANWPRVDANDWKGAPEYARQNRAVGFNYEPGSTFKAFTVAGALETREVTKDTMFDLPPQIQVADRTIGESHERGHITLNTAGILAQSSNVGAIKIGQQLGKQRFDQWVRRFGFGRPTGVDLPGENAGQVLRPEQYSGSSMGNLPIGQGVSVTPMQMATAYAAIANGGVLRPPRIVGAIDGVAQPRPKGRRIISQATAAELRGMLEGVLAPGGTAQEVSIPGYTLAGKTGTANKVDPATGLYSESKYISSFIGFAPADRPRLLVAVMVDEPKGAIFGGQVAAPAFGQITNFALRYLKVPPEPR